jgi:hypothetical protein
MGDDRIEAALGSRELNDRPLGRRQVDRLGTIVARVIGRQSDAFFDQMVRILKYRYLPAFLLPLSLKVKSQHCLVHHLPTRTPALFLPF